MGIPQREAAQLLEVGAVGVSQPESANAMRYPSRYPSPSLSVVSRACPVCGGTPRSSRSVYCEKAACKQRAYRLRHQPQATVDPAVLRKQLKRLGRLVAHTVYECPSCSERFLGERRCPECHLFARSLGLGGSCPDCDTAILLADLLGAEAGSPS